MAVDVGEKFPAFALPNQDGRTVMLDDFAGKWLVVYFYPKDDTPGCTIQGKSFTASKDEYAAANVAVVGVSEDDTNSHRNFCNKFGFKIDLLSDMYHLLQNAAGIGQMEYKGMQFWNRTSFIIDPRGIVRKVYRNVKPDGHEKALLEDIRQLQAQA